MSIAATNHVDRFRAKQKAYKLELRRPDFAQRQAAFALEKYCARLDAILEAADDAPEPHPEVTNPVASMIDLDWGGIAGGTFA